MKTVRSFLAAALCAAVLGACADNPSEPGGGQPQPEPMQPLGVYSVTITGADGSGRGGPATSRAVPVPKDGSEALNPGVAGLVFEAVSTVMYTEGARGAGGQRFVMATFRVRNTTGGALSNVTLIPAIRTNTISGTPFSTLTLFTGAAAPAGVATQTVPAGAVTLVTDGRLSSTYSDVLQVFTEAEVAAVALPAGTTSLFPYGFVVRNPNSASSRTLPAAATSSDWGLVTFAFRYPLQFNAASDPFTFAVQFLAVQDTETRMTESYEERADTAGVRRLRERATALGATTVTVLAGSAAADATVLDYPGQRQICSVRTAGTAASPLNTMSMAGAYTNLLIYRPGESYDACGANFATGTAAVPATGAAYNLTVRAMDRYGNVQTSVLDSVRLSQISGPSVTLPAATPLSSGVATMPVTWSASGFSVLQAAGRNVRGQLTIDVGTASVAAWAGDKQAAMAGSTLPTRPAVRVLDANNNPIAGRSVTFAVADGGGSVTTATVNTDASGVATVGNWTLGSTAQLNTLTATVSGSGVANNPVTFTAAGCEGSGSGYEITLCYNSTLTAAQRTVFQNASARWSQVITGDLTNVTATIPSGACGTGTPGLSMTMDDLVIFAAVEPIDGVGAVLGSAGWCYRRAGAGLPIIGTMRFDAADVASLEAAGQFSSVILHEMGHVIGVGTFWTVLSLLQNTSTVGTPLDTYFSGSNAITGFNSIGGSTYTGGQKVPVENTGGIGTINAHWRESVLQNELMTGYLNSGVANPLSLLTVQSLQDLGYTVNTGAADSFFLTLSLRDGPEEPGLHLMNDVYTGPRYTIDPQGRFSRTAF